jgi:hypothetical protein
MPIDQSEEEYRKITIVDEISSIWADSAGRIPIILRRHAQMYFLPLGMEGFEYHLKILNEAKREKRPVRIVFIEHSGEIVSVDRVAPDEVSDE